ncbi:MAG: hypothetical protein IPP32_00315 [Bacteroidetes bacterium]|nr:hypothetical protein [Bacteroidota bacterium]
MGAGLNNTSACLGQSYYFYSVAQATGSIQQGNSYTLSVTTNTSSIIAAWIDFNHNQVRFMLVNLYRLIWPVIQV